MPPPKSTLGEPKRRKKETTSQSPEGENICSDNLEMEEDKEKKSNSEEEDKESTEDTEMQEVDLPAFIEIYGEKSVKM